MNVLSLGASEAFWHLVTMIIWGVQLFVIAGPSHNVWGQSISKFISANAVLSRLATPLTALAVAAIGYSVYQVANEALDLMQATSDEIPLTDIIYDVLFGYMSTLELIGIIASIVGILALSYVSGGTAFAVKVGLMLPGILAIAIFFVDDQGDCDDIWRGSESCSSPPPPPPPGPGPIPFNG